MRSQVPAWNRTVFHQGIRHLSCFFLGPGTWVAGRPCPKGPLSSIRNPTCFPIINVFVQIGIKNSNSPMLQGNVEMLTFVSKTLSWEHLLTKLNWHRNWGVRSLHWRLTVSCPELIGWLEFDDWGRPPHPNLLDLRHDSFRRANLSNPASQHQHLRTKTILGLRHTRNKTMWQS